MSEQTSIITLRALHGEPLADPRTRETVLSAARAIAERQGIEVLAIESTPASITVTLRTGRIESLGFAAELRRNTTSWYTKKFGEPTLWGEASDNEPGEEWKRR
ncbi:MAG TPA: hypothetical protein PK400_04395 [Phycisphaerales bacterium]|nr:hypothetical protein [Phycisphaerales bacterium]HRQ74938.1 hypothetical protein [Phycisphaerales bacterium]